MSVDELYQELILDHHRHPRCNGSLDKPDAQSNIFNPLCGDEIIVALRSDSKVIEEIRFTGHGCSISQASASMMSELCKGKTVEEVKKLGDTFTSMMTGERKASDHPELGDAISLEGVQQFPARIRCAMLAWEALQQCLAKL